MNTGGGSVGVTNTNKITSYFEGIYAKSTTGAISVESTGDVSSSFSSGIKTVGGTSSTVKVNAGSNVYGIYRGVMFSGGTTNTLNNYGSIKSNTYTYAVSGSTGNETINNFNLITGNVNLDGGTNAFNNKSTGVFVSGTTVNLGNGHLHQRRQPDPRWPRRRADDHPRPATSCRPAPASSRSTSITTRTTSWPPPAPSPSTARSRRTSLRCRALPAAP